MIASLYSLQTFFFDEAEEGGFIRGIDESFWLYPPSMQEGFC